MDNKEFKKHFDTLAKANGFTFADGGWYVNSPESIFALTLQKSNYSNRYELNFKIFIQGFSGKTYAVSKDLMKKDVGHIFRRQPGKYSDIFDLDTVLVENLDARLNEFFVDYLVPFSKKALTRIGMIELAKEKEVILLTAIKNELGVTHEILD